MSSLCSSYRRDRGAAIRWAQAPRDSPLSHCVSFSVNALQTPLWISRQQKRRGAFRGIEKKQGAWTTALSSSEQDLGESLQDGGAGAQMDHNKACESNEGANPSLSLWEPAVEGQQQPLASTAKHAEAGDSDDPHLEPQGIREAMPCDADFVEHIGSDICPNERTTSRQPLPATAVERQPLASTARHAEAGNRAASHDGYSAQRDATPMLPPPGPAMQAVINLYAESAKDFPKDTLWVRPPDPFEPDDSNEEYYRKWTVCEYEEYSGKDGLNGFYLPQEMVRPDYRVSRTTPNAHHREAPSVP